jgi:hypothetical protein
VSASGLDPDFFISPDLEIASSILDILNLSFNMSSTTTMTQEAPPTLATVTQQPAITAENVLRLFPEVNTDLIGGSHNSATNDSALDGYDEEQIRLMDEVCIVLDDNDVPIGSATKKLCTSMHVEATIACAQVCR